MKYFNMAGNSICLLLIVFVCTGAIPHRRTGEDCEEASQALKQLLENHDDWFGALHIRGVTFEYMYEGITGTTLDEFPDDFFCAFNGLESVDDLLLRLYLTGYLQAPFEFMYNYLSGAGLHVHQYLLNEIADPHPWSNMAELRVYDKLLTDLEASGIMSLNPDGFLWFYGMTGANVTDELPDYFPTGDAISTDSVSRQTKRIANDLRKVWNLTVHQMGQHRPDASQFMRDELEQWTGIHLEQGAAAHNTVLSLVNDILETVGADDPMSALRDFFLDRDIFGHAMNTGYPEIVHMISDYEEELEMIHENTDEPGNSYGGSNYGGSYYGYYNYGPSEETLELNYQLIQALRGMGLFDLSYN